MIALHIAVTVQWVFPTGPGKAPADTEAPFGGAPFSRPGCLALGTGTHENRASIMLNLVGILSRYTKDVKRKNEHTPYIS